MAAVYALPLFIREMHNRTGPRVEPAEMTTRDGLVLVPLVLATERERLVPGASPERLMRIAQVDNSPLARISLVALQHLRWPRS